MTGIVNYGLGNVGSLVRIFKKLGETVKILSTPEDFCGVDRLVLPGVGHFSVAMDLLTKKKMIPQLEYLVLTQKAPILGICLGMQMLCRHSEEGNVAGLGWIDADVIRFRFHADQQLKIPNMGWHPINVQREHALFTPQKPQWRFYFVHSYHVVCKEQKNVLATTDYGYDFTCAVIQQNVIGTQFHPEKSHSFGIAFLRNFLRFRCAGTALANSR